MMTGASCPSSTRQKRTPRGSVRRTAFRPDDPLGAAILMCALLLALLPLTFPPPAHADGDQRALSPEPVDFVVLVDESGSLSKADVAAVKQKIAARNGPVYFTAIVHRSGQVLFAY